MIQKSNWLTEPRERVTGSALVLWKCIKDAKGRIILSLSKPSKPKDVKTKYGGLKPNSLMNV